MSTGLGVANCASCLREISILLVPQPKLKNEKHAGILNHLCVNVHCFASKLNNNVDFVLI